MNNLHILCCYALLIPAGLWGQAKATAIASRTDGVSIYYYETLHEAFSSAKADTASLAQPVEITLLADIVSDEPLLVEDGMLITLVAGGGDRIIQRGRGNVEFPLIWIIGESAVLTLGKPSSDFQSAEYELIIDGGYLNNPPIHARAPLIALNGPDAKLVLHKKVTLQNNINNGPAAGASSYQSGAGVFIRTTGDNFDRQAEFIMKGGVIRGNINNAQNHEPKGGGVYVIGSGRFIMEGGVITDNTAQINGGGVHIGARGSFKKTGGIIYGNTAVDGFGSPKIHGHAVSVDIRSVYYFRDDTVKENETLTFSSVPEGGGVCGEGEKWDTPDKVLRRRVFAGVLPVLVIGISVFLVLRKKALKERRQTAACMAHNAREIDLDGSVFHRTPNLSVREREICELLLSELSMKQIAFTLQLTYSGVTFHAQNLYRKLGIQSRTELFTRFGKNASQG